MNEIKIDVRYELMLLTSILVDMLNDVVSWVSTITNGAWYCIVSLTLWHYAINRYKLKSCHTTFYDPLEKRCATLSDVFAINEENYITA